MSKQELFDWEKATPEELKARIAAIDASLPKDFTDADLEAAGAVDVTDTHKGLGIVAGLGPKKK